jgi:hypothetical protein
MGGLHDVEKYVRSGVKELGKDLKFVFDHAAQALHDAARTATKEFTLPTVTLYVQEDIGINKSLKKELDPLDSTAALLTGVYIPPSVKPANKVNVIFYIHGDKVRVWGEKGTIRDYWNLPVVPLRQGLSASGQPFILIAPTLGHKSAAEHGNVGTKIDDHLDHVLAQIVKVGPPEFPITATPTIDRLIIAGHSGAYASISEILSNIKKYRSNIKELWAFDIMYADLSAQLTALGVPVYAYFVAGSDTEGNSRALARKKNPNVFVMENVDSFVVTKHKTEKVRVKHDNLMQRFWQERCQRIGTNGSNPEDKKRMVAG